MAAAPTTEHQLAAYLWTTFGVRLPNVAVCPNHSTPFRAFADAYFARASVSVWKGSRGFAGKSFTLALLATVEAATIGAKISVLGGTGEQAQRVLEAMDAFWAAPQAPILLLASEPGKRETRFAGGHWVRALMASTTSVRGPHPQRLRMDEVDEVDLRILDAAMGQTMALGGIAAQTVLSSTHQYADGTMTEVLRRAKATGWPVHEWCWRECVEPHGWLPASEVRRKRLEVTEAMWNAEYDLQEPNPEGRAIDPAAVEKMFREELGRSAGIDGERVEVEAPAAAGQYTTGADWARKTDRTAIATLRTDCKPMKFVAFERMRRRPWPDMVNRFEERCRRYPGGAAHDGTGLGDVVAGYLTTEAEAVILVGRERSDTFSEYINAIERGDVVAPRVESWYGAHKYASVDDLYGAGHPPDEFVANALAYRAAIHPMKRRPQGAVWGR